MNGSPEPAGSGGPNWYFPALLIVLTLVGVLALAQDLSFPLLLVPIAVAVAIVALRLPPIPSLLRRIGIVVGALVIPVLVLVGVDALWAILHGHRLRSPAASLIVGAAIIGFGAWAFLHPWWADSPSSSPWFWAFVVAVVLVGLPPPVAALIGALKADGKKLAARPDAISRLDLIVLRDGETGAEPPARDTQGWVVETWAGRVRGDQVEWGSHGPPTLAPRNDTDRVLLLVPSDARDPQRWLRLADAVTSQTTPTYALLPTDDAGDRARWRAALAATRPIARHGGALDFQRVAAHRQLSDVALRLGALSPSADQDLALAAKHRPALLFDSAEKYKRPLDVDRLLASGKIHLCERGQAVRNVCTEVHGSGDLRNGSNQLAFDPNDIATVDANTTIYVNVKHTGNDFKNTVYLDYWWYLPDNPTGAGAGALCGAGFVIANVTCFDHPSDWEGVTVILDKDSPSTPAAVAYAQHDGVTRYSWSALQNLWKRGDAEGAGQGIDTSVRPLVFVAQGTHASYPTSCPHEHCRIPRVPGVHGHRPLKENRHDGGEPWTGNKDSGCAPICLTALPTRAEGEKGARWNAYDGPWGTAPCVFGVFCTSSEPPPSPAQQGRYKHPWCFVEQFRLTGGHFVRGDGRCTGRTAAADELRAHERLLALGDSYSSGQGAGNYDPGTTGHGNTCFRSSDAWPLQVARQLRLVALRSLACSGAVVDEVLTGGRGGEAERRISQVSRIDQNPSVVTITIGGNDAGFRKVLQTCIVVNCFKHYHRPTGDVIEARIERLARRLPAVYHAVAEAAPGARVVVVGYPRLFPKPVGSKEIPNCAAHGRISPAEGDYLNSLGERLDGAIADAALTAGVEYINVTEAFDGHEFRCGRPAYVNDLRVGSQLLPASFHPNTAGQARLAEVVADQLSPRR